MSYRQDLDEMSEEALIGELRRREKLRAGNLCDYCERPHGVDPSCKFVARHRGTAHVPTPNDSIDTYAANAMRTEKTPAFVDAAVHPFDFLRLAQLLHALLGLVSEAGEIADALKKTLIYGKPLDQTNLVEEVGDSAWYHALAAKAIGVPLSTILDKNIAKLRARYGDKFTEEKALNRDLAKEREALTLGMIGKIEAGPAQVPQPFDFPPTTIPPPTTNGGPHAEDAGPGYVEERVQAPTCNVCGSIQYIDRVRGVKTCSNGHDVRRPDGE